MAPSNKYDKKKKENQREGEGAKGASLLCCVPADKVFCQNPEIDSLSTAVKCDCSSGKCTLSGYMHADCFIKYEETIVGYMSKAGRGRTWNEKQRYSNVWANKGYDLVFKSCICDCGHGSLRKDVDWVPPKAAPAEGAGQVQEKEKKKKKEKTEGKLRPKLNFAVQTVQGSYYGSNNNREEAEDGEDKPAPSQATMRAFVRESSLDPAPAPPSTPATIPGLCTFTQPLQPQAPKPRAENRAMERTASTASLASSAGTELEEGWVTVGAKERSESGSRRNSVHTIKPRDPPRKRRPSGETTGSSTPQYGASATDIPPRFQKSETPTPKPPPAVAAPQAKTPLPPPGKTAPLQSSLSFPSLLPMFQSQPSPSPTSFASSFALPVTAMGSFTPQNSFYNSFESSALTYRTMDKPKAFIGSELGARPKAGPNLSSSPEDIYLSDEDEEMNRSVGALLKDPTPVTSGTATPKWEEVPSARAGDADREMTAMWEQTQFFEQSQGQPAVTAPRPSEPPAELQGSRQDGKRDTNGFIHCNSCRTVHSNTQEFVQHCRSEAHLENSRWAEKLESSSLGSDMASGWQTFSGSEALWEGARGGRRSVALAPLEQQVKGPRPGPVGSRSETPELRRANTEPGDETARLRQELEKERALRQKVQGEVAALQSGKRLLQQQSLIVENTLKVEEARSKEYKVLSEKLSEKLRSCQFDFEAKSGVPVDSRGHGGMASEVDRLKIKELEETLAAEVSKNETSTKVIKKLKEKVERTEKAGQEEKKARLLAEKTKELAEKSQASEEVKKRQVENTLNRTQLKLSDAEEKLKEETRKRITAEVALVTQRESFEARAKEINFDQTTLVASVDKLTKEKEEIEKKVEVAKVQAAKKLQAQGFTSEEVCGQIFQGSEDIVKQSLLKAMETNEDIDNLEDVKKIFQMVNEALQLQGSAALEGNISDTVELALAQSGVEMALSESYSAGLDEMRNLFPKSLSEMKFANEATNVGLEVIDDDVVVENSDIDVEGIELDEDMLKEEEVDEEVEDETEVTGAAGIMIKHPRIVTISSSCDEDQDSKDDMTDVNNVEEVKDDSKDPFDELLLVKVTESEVKKSTETEVTEVKPEAETEKPKEEKLEDDDDVDRSRSPSLSDPETESIRLSPDPDGLDRYPKLGLDQEIDSYLGSPTVSRPDSPEEQLEVRQEEKDDTSEDVVESKVDEVQPDEAKTVEGGSRPVLEQQSLSSGSSDSAVSPAAWQGEMSDSSTSGLGSELKELLDDPGTARLCCLENSVTELQHLLVNLGTTVSSLSSQVEEGNFKNGLLMKTVEMMQDKNVRLERTVETVLGRNSGLEKSVEAMAGKHSLLERKLSQNQLRAVHGVLDTVQTDPDELSGMKESLLELLASCEGFQKGADEMVDKQKSLEHQMKGVNESLGQNKAEADDVKEQLAKLGDKFSSLNLECQVDKGNIKAQLEHLGYNVAILTTKLPTDSFPSHKDSSTSGIKSQDSSEADTTATSPPPSGEAVKKIVSNLVFANEAAAAADPKRTSCSPKPAEKQQSKELSKVKKVVYNNNAVNHLPQPPYPGMPGSNLWMSPDGGMLAIPPTNGAPPTPGSMGARPPLGAPLPPWARGSMGGMGGLAGSPYQAMHAMYPLNYPAVFYGPPR